MATRCSLAFPHSYHSPSLPSTSTSTSPFIDSFLFHSISLTSPLYVVYEILFIYPFIVRSLYLFSPPPRPYIIIIVDIESHKTSRWETVALNKRQIEYRQIDIQTDKQTRRQRNRQIYSQCLSGVSVVSIHHLHAKSIIISYLPSYFLDFYFSSLSLEDYAGVS